VSLLVVLGSGGWIPEDGRMTTCVAYRTGDVLLLFDAGSGLARLGREPFDQLIPSPNHRIHLFLSHLHLDHIVGLTYLPALWENPTFIHVPEKSVLGVGPEVLDALLGGSFFPVALNKMSPPVAVRTIGVGEEIVEGVRIATRVQAHPGGSLGYRVDDDFAFMTDTTFDPESAALAEGVRLLIHEGWADNDAPPEHLRAGMNGHTGPSDAARVARKAGVQQLLLCHLPPFQKVDYASGVLEEARSIFPETNLAFDGFTQEL
jgi:ribonuclease Z